MAALGSIIPWYLASVVVMIAGLVPAAHLFDRLPTRGVLMPWQERLMAQEPELIRQFAKYLAKGLRQAGHAGVEVRADALLALNGHPHQRLLRPDVNLAGPLPADWIRPAP